MKIHFIIEIEDDGKTRRATVERVAKVAELNGTGELLIAPQDALDIIKKQKPRMVNIAETAPPPIPAEAQPENKDRLAGSGPQFDPGFLAIVRDAPEPFTRASIAAASGVEVGLVTLRLNRMKHHGWLENPAKGLWRRTNSFGLKTTSTQKQKAK